MNVKAIVAGIGALIVLLGIGFTWNGLIGHNDFQEWQVYQSVTGSVHIIDTPGYYYKGFGKVWTYPYSIVAHYSKNGNDLGDSTKVTFNDGGTADVSAYVRIYLPTDTEHRLELHRLFNANPTNIIGAAKAHLTNCLIASGPVMSASENQASRKSEFNQIVEEQLSRGLFKMRRTEIELDDLSEIVGADEKGIKERKAKVQATEIVKGKDGLPIIIQASPLDSYGITIKQFSITEIEYDPATLKQFATKKESYLKAEQAKAERQQEVQQRLMVEEKGRRQVADVQADENQKKERATIQAEQALEVSKINKNEAVTKAQQRAEVAEQTKREAETLRQIAEIHAATAELDKKATISAAEAQQKSIELGGGISEEKRVLATIQADRDAKVASALAGVKVPGVVIVGGNDGASGHAGLTDTLMNLLLLRSTGVLPTAQAAQ
jgi:hypothetical protein